MLSEEVENKLAERLSSRIAKVNSDILQVIAERIKTIGTLDTVQARQLAQIFKYGGDINKITQEISKATNMNIEDIYNIYSETAKSNQQFAKQFYKYKNINFIPYDKNIALQHQVKAMAEITGNEFINLSKTMAFARLVDGKIQYLTIADTYRKVIDTAVISITQGKETFEQNMARVMNELANSGIRTVDYASGYSRRLDSAVYENIRGGIKEVTLTMQKQFGKEFGADGIEISVHTHPAPDHAPIQGHQFSNEEFKKLQNGVNFEDYKGYKFQGIKRAIGEWNCYHYIFSIVLGISNPANSQKQLDKILQDNEKGFEFEGNHYTLYEGTQLQRRLETQIRQEKDKYNMAKITNNNILKYKATNKIRILKDKYMQISKASGLKTRMERLKIY